MTYSVVSVFGLVFVLALLTAAVLLIVFSRGKGNSYPACGKCGYDVSGSVGSVTRCPECGLDFTEAGIIPPGSKRNPFMFVGGIVLLVLTLGCFGSLFLAGTSSVQTISIPAQPITPAQPGSAQGNNGNEVDQTESEAEQIDPD